LDSHRKNEKNTILLTGGSSEIGEKIAVSFVAQGDKVIIASDNAEASLAVQKRIFDKFEKKIDLIICDFTSQLEIKELAEDVKNRFPELNVLINNMSITADEYSENEDSIETTFYVNYLSRFLLSNLLTPAMAKNNFPRILNIDAECPNNLNFDFVNYNMGPEDFDSELAESRAALADCAFVIAMAEKIKNIGVTINAVNPGRLSSDYSRQVELQRPWTKYFRKFDSLFSVSPDKAADIVKKIINNDSKKVSAKYYIKYKQCAAPYFAANSENREKLWTLSNKLCESDFD
jgi:NAD(P)-dependent dehydrogenase (short-subunit alcohol dehydrogenase family)